MMIKYLAFSWLLTGFLACSSSTQLVEVKNEEGTVIERFYQNKKTQTKDGKFEYFGSSGKLLEEANYENGILNGERILYDENGNIQARELYKNGVFSGLYRSYYPNGQVELAGNYIDGAMNGVWKRYYADGRLMEEVLFVNNQENGAFTEYHPNGNLKAEGAYLNGDKEHGELKLYDESGTLVKKMNCQRGVCKTIWEAQ